MAEAGFDRGLSVEAVVPLGEGAQAGPRAAALFEEVARRGPALDLASVRCPAPQGDDEARLQAAALARVSQALAGVPVMRRGTGDARAPRAAPRLADRGVRGRRRRGRQRGRRHPARARGGQAEATSRASPLERAAGELSGEGADRLEARAYVEVMDFLERLGARGGAVAGVARARAGARGR